MATHTSILAEEFHGQRSLPGYSPWGCKELDMTKQLAYNSTQFSSSENIYDSNYVKLSDEATNIVEEAHFLHFSTSALTFNISEKHSALNHILNFYSNDLKNVHFK